MKTIALLMLMSLAPLFAAAQTIISGMITDKSGEPVENVIVKLLDGSKMVGYGMSNVEGKYSVKTKSEASTLTLTAERLSYAKSISTVENKTSTIDITLEQKVTELREVTVSSPIIYVHGDTLTFRLDAFKGKGDISLKDALKKIPGIEIDDNGKIKYNGKAISHFYIEGMDMLGGRYNIATDNIPANYVQAVQILNNHKDVKIDKSIYSDDVAINIKLEPWAKFKPMGTYEAAAGYSDRWLYRLGGAGMMFNKKFQSILTAKIGNAEEFSSNATIVLNVLEKQRTPNIERILGNLSALQPPVSKNRYCNPDDRSVTINLLNKISDDKTMKTNVSYTYAKSRYDYSTIGRYYDGADQLVITQNMSPESRLHKPELSLEYQLNSDKQYLTNKFSSNASFFDASLPTETNGESLSQNERMTMFNIQNVFSSRWKRGRWSWGVRSQIEYHGGPEGRIDVSAATSDGRNICQTAKSSQFYTSEAFSTVYERLYSRISFPLELIYSNEHISTNLHHDITGFSVNKVTGNDFMAKLSPSYNYTHPRNILNINAVAGITGRVFDYDNNGSVPDKQKSVRLTINPQVNATWNMSSRSALAANIGYHNNVGDILDMLTSGVAQNYLSVKARSGVMSETRVMSAYLRYDYKRPVEMLYLTATVNHDMTRINVLSAQSVNAGIIGSYYVDRPTHGRNTSISGTATKQIRPIKTKFVVRASYSFGRQEMFQNDEVIPYNNRSYLISPSVNSRPCSFIELNYNVSLGRTYTSYANVKRSYFSQDHRGKLTFFFAKNVSAGVSNEMSWRELTPGVTKFISLLDAEASYTLKSFRFSMKLSNLLDKRNYAYTVFSGLDNFTYDYRLRGRELMLSISFTK